MTMLTPRLRLILIRAGLVLLLLWGAIMALSFFPAAMFHRGG